MSIDSVNLAHDHTFESSHIALFGGNLKVTVDNA